MLRAPSGGQDLYGEGLPRKDGGYQAPSTRPALAVEVLPCGRALETKDHVGKRVMAKCAQAQALKAEVNAAGEKRNDWTTKGGARVKLFREFDRKCTAFREHVGPGA